MEKDPWQINWILKEFLNQTHRDVYFGAQNKLFLRAVRPYDLIVCPSSPEVRIQLKKETYNHSNYDRKYFSN